VSKISCTDVVFRNLALFIPSAIVINYVVLMQDSLQTRSEYFSFKSNAWQKPASMAHERFRLL